MVNGLVSVIDGDSPPLLFTKYTDGVVLYGKNTDTVNKVYVKFIRKCER